MLGTRPLCGAFSLIIETVEVSISDLFSMVDNQDWNFTFLVSICDYLAFDETLRRVIPLSISDTVTFDLVELEVLNDKISFSEVLGSNYDDQDPCEGIIISSTANSDILILAETLTVAIDWEISISDTFSINETIAWSPI